MNKDELERLASLQIRGMNQARNSSEVLFLLSKLVEAVRILDARTRLWNKVKTDVKKVSDIKETQVQSPVVVVGKNGCGIKLLDPDNLGKGFLYFTGNECEFVLVDSEECQDTEDENG